MKITLLALFGFSVAASAQTFTYTLNRYPLADVVACHKLASDVTQAFQSEPSLSYPRGLCTKFEAGFGNIEIQYEADKRVVLTATPKSPSSVYTAWRYKTLGECQQRLSGQVSLFQSETGLTPFVSYCYSDSGSSYTAFLPRIEAFGAGTKQPRLGGFTFFNKPKGFGFPEFRKGIYEKLQRTGDTLADLTVSQSPAMSHANIHYYSAKALEFNHREVGHYPAFEECTSRAETLRTDLASLKNAPAFHYCGYVSVPGRWELNTVVVGSVDFLTRDSAEEFPLLKDCETKKADLKKFYEQSVGKASLSGICTFVGNVSRYRMFWEN